MQEKNGKIKILFCAFEASPFIKTGGLGDVAGSLPAALNAAGADCRLILPKHGSIAEKYTEKMRHVADFTVSLAWRNQYCGIESLRLGGVTCYFIDNEYYFKRPSAYGYYDDAERVAFFSMAVLEAPAHIKGWFPQVLHFNDWHCAMAPVFLKNKYSGKTGYNKLKTVFSVHNLRFQGKFDPAIAGDVMGLSYTEAENSGLFRDNCLNMMQGALVCSDAISTVSPTYAKEICTPEYGEGMEDVFRSRSNVLSGILNGIDTKFYNPETDRTIPFRYGAGDLTGKARNKAYVQKELGLPVKPDAPLAVLISRLTDQKGLDLVLRVCDELLDTGMQFAILGTGDKKYENAFKEIGQRRPESLSAAIRFDEALSHRMYAGADMVLMPSLFEPCGLTQMYGLRYGALPIVRETGGLKDSVIPYNKYTGEGTGFSFANYNAHEMLFTVQRAVELYNSDKEMWARLTRQAMAQDFSWLTGAEKYLELYKALVG